MLEMMFWGVIRENTELKIHKYSVYANTGNDKMTVIPIMCYIFEKPLIQGCHKWYSELSDMEIKKYKYKNTVYTQIQNDSTV